LTIVVLLILAGIWAAVLVPMVRSRVEPGTADSIGNFRRQLGVLQRSGPVSVAPANRLRVPPYNPGVPTPYTPYAGMRSAARLSPDAARRARTLKRRRDVLFTLAGGAAATLVLGLLPPLRMLWLLHVVFDLLLAGYVALLVRIRNEAAEREIKLRFLPHAAGMPGSPEMAPARLRSAN
jgi:hypothetical protein